jgi:small conductance mechanosensitive channel
MAGAYRPMVKQILEYQRQEYASDPEGEECAARTEYPELGKYFRDFMIAVFLLFTALFITTQGDTASLTYSIVRGVWVRGINAATITTCIMLMSVVFAIRFFVNIILSRLGKYMSPKAKTLWRLFDSAFAYVGTIVLIIYALSLFGVDTTTLVGGVGITALIFTLGANSLIADVLAGIFIIFEDEYHVGEIVTINDFRGTVLEIGIRSTKLLDAAGNIKIINNSSIGDVINLSRELSLAVVDCDFPYDVPVELVENLLKNNFDKISENIPAIKEGPYYKGVCMFKDSNVTIKIVAKCLEEDRFQVERDIRRAYRQVLVDNNIDIAYPQVVLNYPTEKEYSSTKKTKKDAKNFNDLQKQLSKDLEDQENN